MSYLMFIKIGKVQFPWYYYLTSNRINLTCFLLGNKTLCEICNAKTFKRASKKKEKDLDEEEGQEQDGIHIPVDPLTPCSKNIHPRPVA